MSVTLTEAKLHCRVDDSAEDALISSLIDAAEQSILLYLNTETLPEEAPVHAAALMLVGALYENREAITDRPLSDNRLFDRLLAPYRNYDECEPAA